MQLMQYLFYQKAYQKKKLADWIKTNTPDMVAQLWPEIEASIDMEEGE
jgi:hypothetical protein